MSRTLKPAQSRRSLKRVVRRYRITRTHGETVTVKWDEKYVPDPENPWHWMRRSGGWKKRQKTMAMDDLHKHWAIRPPNAGAKP